MATPSPAVVVGAGPAGLATRRLPETSRHRADGARSGPERREPRGDITTGACTCTPSRSTRRSRACRFRPTRRAIPHVTTWSRTWTPTPALRHPAAHERAGQTHEPRRRWAERGERERRLRHSCRRGCRRHQSRCQPGSIAGPVDCSQAPSFTRRVIRTARPSPASACSSSARGIRAPRSPSISSSTAPRPRCPCARPSTLSAAIFSVFPRK